MNAVEIEEAISELANAPFDAAAFPFAFLESFGNKATTLNRLRKGESNKTDVAGAVLQFNNIHLAACTPGDVPAMLEKLRSSPATARQKAKFILATDGVEFQAEDLLTGETVACDYKDFPDHFGLFLPLAGITTVKQIRESSFDIRATSRLNKLYVQLLKDNPDWGTTERRPDMNHFMARLIFCFFAEDTDIFHPSYKFTDTVQKMSATDSSNTHAVIGEIFSAMNIPIKDRAAAELPRWADAFPYVNGGLFSGSAEAPTFSKIARSYLIHIGNLDWKQINPDIFGSMIQAVAEDDERGALGMHYTSVPNILKVLNPLFLDDLRAQLEAAEKSPQKLLNLRKRMARIRVFDPACGSGNFLVIAYKQMREIEAEINRRRGEEHIRSEIPLTNFRGIELRDFPAEIARLSLIIAEYQCDVLYRGQKEALNEFLPLDTENWITCGNALRLDWLSVCQPEGVVVKLRGDDLLTTPTDQAHVNFENEGGETYICGNPPYLGSTWQSDEQKADLKTIFDTRTKSWKSLDYVAGWFMKAADYGTHTNAAAAFVSTNSICQGQQVAIIWPLIFQTSHEIFFAHTSFTWANLASHNAGVTVIIVGISNHAPKLKSLFSAIDGETAEKKVVNINPYLVPAENIIVNKCSSPISNVYKMDGGNKPADGGHLVLESYELPSLNLTPQQQEKFIRPYVGSAELIRGTHRYCIWIDDTSTDEALKIPSIAQRVKSVKEFRLKSTKAATVSGAKWPHRFDELKPLSTEPVICVPVTSSENRPYLPVDLLPAGTVISNLAFGMSCKELWPVALIASRMNLVWVATVCSRMRTDYRYTNTIAWNTFPIPAFTEKNKADLTHCAEDILLAREAHFPATIAELYDPEKMPENLRHAHERNDEVLERIYIGRRFRNDSERLEKLFDLYTKMTATKPASRKAK